jgi:hypothetical protein
MATTFNERNPLIVQLLDAVMFKAVFADANPDSEEILYSLPLAGWALCRWRDDEGVDRTSVRGLMAGAEVAICENTENFLGYTGPGEEESVYRDDAIAYLKEHGIEVDETAK